MNQNQPGEQRPQDETGPLVAQQPAGSSATAVSDLPPAPPAPPTAPPAGPPTGSVAAGPKRPNPLRRIPRTAWLAAAAVVVLVGVGLGGFFIGRATADGDGGGFPDRGQRPDFPGGGRDGQMPGMPGQDGQFPGGGQQGQQGQPGSSTDDGTDSGTPEDSADTTAWFVVPSAA